MDALSVAVGAIAAFVSAVGTYWVTGRQIRARLRTRNRKVWINRVITTAVDLMAVCEHTPEAGEEVTRLAVELHLLLNPKATDESRSKLKVAREGAVRLIEEIHRRNTAEGRETLPDVMRGDDADGLRPQILQHIETILGQEWRIVLKET